MLGFSFLLQGCADREPSSQPQEEATAESIRTGQEITEAAASAVNRELRWNHHTTGRGELVRLFRPSFPPDERRDFVTEGEGRRLHIAVVRYGPSFKAFAIDRKNGSVDSDFSGDSFEECLAMVRKRFEFTGEFKRSEDCAWP